MLRVDGKGFIWFGDFRLPMRVDGGGLVEFVDNDRRRSAARGTRFVLVDARELGDFLEGEGRKGRRSRE